MRHSIASARYLVPAPAPALALKPEPEPFQERQVISGAVGVRNLGAVVFGRFEIN